jgi:hypothetical protein
VSVVILETVPFALARNIFRILLITGHDMKREPAEIPLIYKQDKERKCSRIYPSRNDAVSGGLRTTVNGTITVQ